MKKGNGKEVSSPHLVRHPSVRKTPTFFHLRRNVVCGCRANRLSMLEWVCGHCANRSYMPEWVCGRCANRSHMPEWVRRALGTRFRDRMGALRGTVKPLPRPNGCAVTASQPLVHRRTGAPRREPAHSHVRIPGTVAAMPLRKEVCAIPAR